MRFRVFLYCAFGFYLRHALHCGYAAYFIALQVCFPQVFSPLSFFGGNQPFDLISMCRDYITTCALFVGSRQWGFFLMFPFRLVVSTYFLVYDVIFGR
jgi:hypothetical protein